MDLNGIFNHVSTGGTVLTATRRLSRELISNYDQRQLDAGRKAWPGADILPRDAWLQRTWDEIQGGLAQPPLLLGEAQATALWRQIIEQDIEQIDRSSLPLWNHYATAREANRAWRLVQEWCLDLDQAKSSVHSDHRAFLRWCEKFTACCDQNRWVDSARLSELLQESISKPIGTPILLCGFDQVTPRLQSLIQGLTEHGSRIDVMEWASRDYRQAPCRRYADEYAQWMAAGHWARQQIDRNPVRRVAIVAPDLQSARSVIEYALRQTLCPGDLMQPADSAQLPFHLSLGRPLVEYDVARAAMELLETLTVPALQPGQVRALILSPHIAGFHSEYTRRGLLLQRLERRLNYYSTLDDLSRGIKDEDHCPQLQKLLAAIIDKLETSPEQASYRQWSEWFGSLLGSTGWPGDGERGSDVFQVMEAFRSQLETLGEIDLVASPVKLDAALSLLRNRLGSQIFQVEAHDAPVQVMGVLESAGMTFDGVWLGDLIEGKWPGRATPNPFIPVPIQQEAGIPEASSNGSAALCEQQMQRLAGSTAELQLGCYAYDGEVEIAPSPLIAECPVEGVKMNQVDLAQQIFDTRPTRFNKLKDNHGPSLAKDARPGGGTSLIRTQSRCPRQAFLQYRLHGTEGETRQQGLDPSRRGSLIHRLLELIWQDIRDSKALAALSDSALKEKITPRVVKEAGRLFYASGCGHRFFAVQQNWLVATLMEWFSVERQRTKPFTVLGREEKASLSLSGLDLEFRIDRIDRFEDGSLGLIDYKTGGILSVSDWGNQRPDEPQLPLYWLTREQPVSMVAYGKVRLGECAITGLTGDPQLASRSKPVKLLEPADQQGIKDNFSDWQKLGEHWQDAMENLAREFVEGVAVIDPRNHGLCRQCPTPAFCRTGNQPVSDTRPVDGSGDDAPR